MDKKWINTQVRLIGVFPKWKGNSMNSVNLGNPMNHWSINWGHFKDPLYYLCLAGAAVASIRGLLHKRLQVRTFLMTNKFCHWICWMQWKHLGKTQMLFWYKLFTQWSNGWIINILAFCQRGVSHNSYPLLSAVIDGFSPPHPGVQFYLVDWRGGQFSLLQPF